MVKRSLQASLIGIQEAKRAFALKEWTQDNLAAEVNLKTRQPIWRFFSGRPVERHTFIEICSVLELNWREIASNPPAEFMELEEYGRFPVLDIDGLVKKVRSQRFDKIQDQCGILQLLDISRPVAIDDIYINVNILESIASQQWLEITALQNLDPKQFDRFGLGDADQNQIPGTQAVETYSKLRVLGKPGVGKTTFLQYLAIQSNQGTFAGDLVPIFITLRNFAEESKVTNEFSLLKYIRQEFLTSEISDSSVIETLLNGGRVLILLDGMDEILNQQSNAVLSEIRRFSEKYHKNQFVAACRTASQKLRLRGFTDVEIAPFTSEQIIAFAQKWFVAFTKTNIQDGQALSVQFVEKLELDENWQFRQLVVTPLFLHLACWVFHAQEKFPTKRTDFYKQGLDLLLGKWDEAKGIERDEVYRGFLLPQKLKLLSQIAAATFEQGQYFFEQRIVEQYIGDYIQNLTKAPMDAEELQIESEAALKAIEAQHGLLAERARGIFSFSYLAFQEYFTARKIVASHNLEAFGEALEGLVSHLTDPHWHEIFLLTATMLRSADSLVQLMKQQIDALVSQDPYLQEFLTWASQKSRTIPSQPKEATTRAFYLALSRTPHIASHFALASSLDQGMFLDAALNNLLLECAIEESQDFAHIHACGDALSNILGIVLDVGLYKSLQQLSDQFPNSRQSQERFTQWWQTNYSAWVKQLNITVVNYRNINHQWQFSPEQEQVLQRYYDANQLLLDCLHSNCEVTAAIRQEIEATLLLPQKELEDREWQ
ncbi:NACHT domain-containing NTPase [Nostoc sp. UCD121]|uniref:NACHT domain-containing protein n=1 Tax=unclassified Nostoc TaxID=2593658 RepID=UPI00162726DF|nr:MULTISPECIES: NACHT domain-containing NTPase [unclassified Nostoc]MBC1220701.1 NACHT domain-containing NTPase [Nostoc sp. UCD120]MBC1281134.1 NACHT domain-containing NTPase [Nostoc sp. UCD121]MBC1299685.1 NACHT domain-containing NTPase [Nostoc sp. UCD122]